ncbi:translation initiation factor IF-2-like, partial [Homarus americanus]|uniref:translation initiation factor IF-2-like n=1 Tax=Homarus americanus TaxID=6706 RepID=UPI001C475942
ELLGVNVCENFSDCTNEEKLQSATVKEKPGPSTIKERIVSLWFKRHSGESYVVRLGLTTSCQTHYNNGLKTSLEDKTLNKRSQDAARRKCTNLIDHHKNIGQKPWDKKPLGQKPLGQSPWDSPGPKGPPGTKPLGPKPLGQSPWDQSPRTKRPLGPSPGTKSPWDKKPLGQKPGTKPPG